MSAFYGKYTSSDNRCIIVDGELKYFARVGLTSYNIPEGVTTIGDQAFYQCGSLENVNIPEGVTTIGDQAFYQCGSLENVNIPEGVTTIGYDAFFGCALSSITIPSSVTYMGSQAFADCVTLSSVYCKATILPKLYNGVFERNASARKIYVPHSSVTLYRITKYWNTYADDIVGEDFGEKITPPSNQIWYTSTDGKIVTLVNNKFGSADFLSNVYENGKGVITFDGSVTEIGEKVFYNCDNLETIYLPSEVTAINYGAFQDCSKLVGISMGNKITTIGVNAFENCVSLFSVEVPNSVTILDRFSFSRSGIEGIIISENVKSMGEYAFQNCWGNIYCKATTPPTIESNTLTLYLKKIYVPSGYVSTYKNAENWKYFAKLIEGYNE